MKVSLLRRQLLFLALAPALAIATLLTAYQVFARLESLDEDLTARLHTVSRHFASLSEYVIYSGDVSTLELAGIQRNLAQNPEFEYAAMRSADNKVLIEYGNPLNSRVDLDRLPQAQATFIRDNSVIHHHPVTDQSPDSGGVLDPASESTPPAEVVGWTTVQYTLRGLQRQQREALRDSLAITLFGLLLGALFAYRLGVRIEIPIRRLVDTVRRLGRGELDVRADLGVSGELGALERGINLMATALERSHRQLQDDIDRATEDLQRSLETVRAHESRYRELVQNIGCLILQTDARQRIVFVNRYAEVYFGLRADDLVGKELVGTIVMPAYAEEAAAALSNPSQRSNIVGRHLGPRGERLYINWSIRTLLDEQGRPAGALGVGIDITERYRYQRSIDILAGSSDTIAELYPQIARAAGMGLDYRWSGILAVDRDGGAPRIETLLEFGHPLALRNDGELLQVLTEILEGGEAVEMVTGLPEFAPDRAGKAIRPQTLIALPLQGSERLFGLLFTCDSRSHHPTETGRQILKLCAERLSHVLQRDWTERQLTRARDEAVSATQSKSRLLANVSHEIRTPMNGIVGFARLLLRQPLNPQQRHQVELIDQSANALLHIINDILDLSRIEVGKMVLRHEPVDPVIAIEEVSSLFAQRIHDKGLELSLGIDGEMPAAVRADPVRFRQLIENLLGNAVKFTAEGSIRIRLSASDTGHDRCLLRVSVRDTGPGIDRPDRQRLFEAFSQVPENGTSHREGTGLGLSICHQVVQLFGGEIGVDSELGHGSCFWFTLPLETCSLANSSQGALSGLQVAMQEPNGELGEAGASLLRHAGAEVTLFGDDPELLRHLDECDNSCDVVTLSMPAGGQERICERVAALREHHHGPVLVLTTGGGLDCGAERCLHCSGWCAPKPLQLRTLIAQRPMHGGPAGDATPPLLPRALHVLVVDDNEINRLLATTLLDEAGCRCSEAADGVEAVEQATTLHPDLILMDVQMPRLDGCEARDLIVELLGPRTPRMIALTAFASPETRRDLLGRGFDDVLDKPLIEGELWHAIRTIGTPGDAPDSVAAPAGNATDVGPSMPVYDPERALAITGGKGELSMQMVRMLLPELPDQRSQIEGHWRDGEFDELGAVLHKLGGSAQYCALAALADAIERCERALESGTPGDAQAAVDDVLVEIDRAGRFDYAAVLGLPVTG